MKPTTAYESWRRSGRLGRQPMREHIRDIRGSEGKDKIRNPAAGGPVTACVACGRVIRASKNGHPRRHAPIVRGSRADRGQGTCDGTFLPGEPP